MHVYSDYSFPDYPNLYKRYGRFDNVTLRDHRDALAAYLPFLTKLAQIHDVGLEMVEHGSETIVAAVAEMIAHVERATHRVGPPSPPTSDRPNLEKTYALPAGLGRTVPRFLPQGSK